MMLLWLVHLWVLNSESPLPCHSAAFMQGLTWKEDRYKLEYYISEDTELWRVEPDV